MFVYTISTLSLSLTLIHSVGYVLQAISKLINQRQRKYDGGVTVKFTLVSLMWSPKRQWMKLCNLIKFSSFRNWHFEQRKKNSMLVTPSLDANREFAIICYSNKENKSIWFHTKVHLTGWNNHGVETREQRVWKRADPNGIECRT